MRAVSLSFLGVGYVFARCLILLGEVVFWCGIEAADRYWLWPRRSLQRQPHRSFGV